MDHALAPGAAPKSAIFQDGLGERRRISDVSGAETIEQLCLRSELTAIPSFEFALRERASRVANFRHAYYGRVRSIDRLTDPASTLAVVSDSIKGVRLANLLAANERRPLTLDINASLHLVRQVVSAVAMLHETARDVAHGAIGPERIIVTPNARIVVVEYVLGAALEQLRFSRERYWRELRVALPASPALPHFDHRADVTQIGVVALSLVLGRLLHDDEFPDGAADILELAPAISSTGEHRALPPALRSWIGRALQLDSRHSFANAIEARDELDRVLSADEEGDEEAVAIVGPAASAAAAEQEAAARSRTEPAAPAVSPSPEPAKPATPPAPAVRPVSEPAPAAVKVEPQHTPTPRAEAAFASTPVLDYADTRPTLDADEDDDEDDIAAVAKPGLARAGLSGSRLAMVAAAAVVVLALGGFAARKLLMAPAATPTGTLSINTNPPGAQVLVDGQSSGVTPLTLALKPGPHNVELRGGAEPRTVPVTITAGTTVSQYVELPKAVTAFGQLQVRTEPVGAQVTVDGIPRGKSPVLVESLAAGEHTVALDPAGANVKHTVSVEAGMTASLVVTMPSAAEAAAPASGWITVSAPVEVQLYENKRLIGTSQSDRVMVSAGKHDIEIVNEGLGYRATRSVQVAAGKQTPLRLEWPKGTIAINALPWAEVWIDGDRVGETPIGNLSLPIGPHELIFRHPDLGEQRYAATVTLREAARVSVDLRKK